MGISEEDVKLAIERIKHIITQESNTISSVYDSGDFQVIIELTNGMNLHLSTGELQHRADEQRDINRFCCERSEAIQIIADQYIKTINADALEGDNTILNSLLTGEGMTPLDKMSDESLVVEFKELFNKELIITD
jgi:hypothetical protein